MQVEIHEKCVKVFHVFSCMRGIGGIVQLSGTVEGIGVNSWGWEGGEKGRSQLKKKQESSRS